MINGKGLKGFSRRHYLLSIERCIGTCLAAVEDKKISDVKKLWSSASTWPKNKVPAEGEDVEILPGENIVFDLEESPILN